jgi:hypothetical protein
LRITKTEMITLLTYNTDKGYIYIKLIREYNFWYPHKGDDVLLGDKSQAPDGLYIFYGNIDRIKSISVERGKVSKIEEESPLYIVMIIIISLTFLLFTLIYSIQQYEY